MSHYYKYDPTLKDDIHNFEYTFKKNTLKFTSNSGVFSKERVDFGTNVLLNSLPPLENASKVLNLGCGVGIIGICIKKAYENANVDMVDINERCIELSKLNASLNKIDANIYLSDMYEKVEGTFDLIISNPPIRAGKQKVFEVIYGAKSHLENGGKVICVINKKQGADSLFKHMEEVFENAAVINKEKGYMIIESVYNK